MTGARAAQIVGLLTVIGAGFRIANARQDLFADELATYWVVDRDLVGVVRTVASTAEITPPLSFLLSWLTTQLGFSEELLRLPALLAGIATIPMVFALGRRLLSTEAGLVAAGLTTFSPFMILYSAEARGYGVLMALLVGSTLAMLRAIESDRPLWWVTHAACVCLAMYTHYTAVFVLGVQLCWALWAHAPLRKPLVAATAGAALLYLPWLPSVKGDLDSPTTDILSSFSPLSIDMARVTLGHWSVGFPYALPGTSLEDLPGVVPLVLLAVAVALGLHGVWHRRGTPWADRGQVGLAVLLTLATPLGTLAQSAIGANVFSVRSLGASWPYLAITASAVLVASLPRLRSVAIGLALGVFALSSVTMLGSDFRRPDYTTVARFADAHGAVVVVNGAAFPPGPLTQLDVEGSRPAAPVLRLAVPEQTDRPFAIGDLIPDTSAQLRRAAEIAAGEPILVVTIDPATEAALLDELTAEVAPGYVPTHSIELEAMALFDLRAVVLERDGG